MWASPANAECSTAPSAETFQFALAAEPSAAPETAAGPTESDRSGRIVAPVWVNDQGPFRFIVDTGANRSVLSTDLAMQMGIATDGHGDVHSVYGAAPAPMVNVRSVRYGDLVLSNGRMPMLDSAVLAGEHGLLGVDGMVDRFLMLDFARNCIAIVPSRQAIRPRGRDWTMVRGELRFGHLIVVHGEIDGVGVNVLLDTGADASLGNTALRDAIVARRAARGRRRERMATANETIVMDHAVIVSQLQLAGLQANDVPTFIGDFHIFNLWGLQDEPTILLGMDVLSQADAMAIDYGRATVHFRVTDRRSRQLAPAYRARSRAPTG